MAYFNITSQGELIYLQSDKQLIACSLYDINIAFSAVERLNYINAGSANDRAFEGSVLASSLNAASYVTPSPYSSSPDSINGCKLGLNSTTLQMSVKDGALIMLGTSLGSPQINYNKFGILVIYRTTDGYWIPAIGSKAFATSATNITYQPATSSEYGYLNTETTVGSLPNPSYMSGVFSSERLADISDALKGAQYIPPTDPYSQGGTSGKEGGGGNFDLSSDAVDFPNLPTLTAVSTGLVSVYTPNLTQLNALASFLWNANPTDIDWWKKLVANPLDLILGLSIVPVAVPAGASQNIKVGLIDTGVAVTKAASQFVEVLCGSIDVPEYWGSALDYSPFRRFSIYLPFIGTRTISTDDIMGKTVEVRYHVDLLSGACVAMVKCGDAVLYQYSGACAVSLPLSGETFTNVITSTIQLAASIGATVATGGAAAGVTAASAANSLMSMKPIVERAGGVSGAAGQLGVMTPYLIGEIPRQSVPENANAFMGYPSNITAVIGDLTGYTEVDLIHISGIEATQAELDELEEILKGGFII